MSFGLQLYKDSGVLALNTDSINMFIGGITEYVVSPSSIYDPDPTLPYRLLTGMPSFGNSDTCPPIGLTFPTKYTSYMRPVPMIAFTVGARMWDVWLMSYGDDMLQPWDIVPNADNPDDPRKKLYDYQTVSYRILNATSVTVMSLQTVSKTDELGNNYLGDTVPSETYGLEVLSSSGERIWTSEVQQVSVSNIVTIDIKQIFDVGFSHGTIHKWHIVAPRALLPHEDFFITPTMVGTVTFPYISPKATLMLERVSSTEYVLTLAWFDYLVANSPTHANTYPEWLTRIPTFTGTDERANLNYNKIQFIAGIMDK